jgi:hypothetical protein
MIGPTSLLVAAVTTVLAAGAPSRPPQGGPAGRPAPTVSLSCSTDSQFCEATASGGSGEGYSFDWAWPVQEQSDADGYSAGNIVCYPAWGWFTISVTVTDSNNSSGYASTQVFCAP